jgi:ribose/xylose/arabinose/galactoside ABC-type transport system permease subunit
VAREADVSRFLLRAALEHFPWLVAAFILAVMVVHEPAFQRLDYWLNLSEQYFAAAVLALALTPIVLTGGIDLSVGSVTVFVSVVVGVLLRDAHWSIPSAMMAGLVAGLLAGLLNGALVTIGVMPLVITLATRELFRGLAFTLSGDAPVTNLPAELAELWDTPIVGVPLPLLAIGLLLLVSYAFIHHTWIGRALYAMGDNETAARFAGLPVRRIKLAIYAVSGALAGVCGIAVVMRFGAAKADAEKSLELTAIAAVVLGGIRVTGGSGHVGGTLLGIITVAVLLAGLHRVPANGRDMVLGVLLIAVAVSNEAARRWAARRALTSS